MKKVAFTLSFVYLAACSHKNLETTAQTTSKPERTIATAQASAMLGQYVSRTSERFDDDAGNKKNCLADGGKYDKEGTCMIPVTNKINVKRTKAGQFKVTVTTWGADLDSCDFEGIGAMTSEYSIRAEQKAEYGTYDTNHWPSGTTEGICQLDFVFNGKAVKMTAVNPKVCEGLCGNHASLGGLEARKR